MRVCVCVCVCVCRPGEKARHFECGHPLHADCFAVYVCSAANGHTCPICTLDRPSVRNSNTVELEGDEGFSDDDDYHGRYEEGDEGEYDDEYGGPPPQQSESHPPPPQPTPRGFTEDEILNALALARGDGEEEDDDADAREELELQAALQLSVRRD